MKRLKCTVAYAGAAYEGWQSQKNGRSVQEQIEAALFQIACRKINITASGRTDAGVNAMGQVFHFDTELEMTPRKWMGAINAKLPKDIHIMDAEEAPPYFHARFCVRRKQYDYRINLGPYDVFTRDTAYQCPVRLDVDRMYEASRYFIGTHDFTSFNSTTLREMENQVRTVTDITFEREGNILKMSFTGKGFLRYMVRMMAGQLVEVGKGKLQPEDIKKMLDARSKTIPRRNAPANGLTLARVDYFDILAMNDEIMIREFLDGDSLPAGTVLSQLEADVREKNYPCMYAVTKRKSQEILGVCVQKDDSTFELEMYDQSYLETAENMVALPK